MTMVEDLYIFSKVVEPLLIQCFLILSIQGSRGFEILFKQCPLRVNITVLHFYFINMSLLWLITRFTSLLGTVMEFKPKSLKIRTEQQKSWDWH